MSFWGHLELGMGSDGVSLPNCWHKNGPQYVKPMSEVLNTTPTTIFNKVINTMVIGPLDDRTYCARSALIRLGLWLIYIDVIRSSSILTVERLSRILSKAKVYE